MADHAILDISHTHVAINGVVSVDSAAHKRHIILCARCQDSLRVALTGYLAVSGNSFQERQSFGRQLNINQG